MLGFRPPGPAFQILCLEGNVKLAFHVRVLRYPYSVLRFNQVYGKLVKVFPCVRIAYRVYRTA